MPKRIQFLSILLLLFVLFFAASSFAQSAAPPSLQPLESVLNPDGSFHPAPGLSGSFDPTGWRLFLGAHGQPIFSRTPGTLHTFQKTDSDTGDIHWDDSFPGPIGTNGLIDAIAVHNNDVYLGGNFTGTESIQANNIVRWDGTSWSALGTGVDGPVSALAFVGNTLYVGGYFRNAGGIPANRIAAWNGNSWSALGQSPNDGVDTSGWVASLTRIGSDLYVGGHFASAGPGIPVGNIARWDGSAWHDLGGGTSANDDVYTMANDGASVYAAGYIYGAGGSTAHFIARWDGTAWHTLGNSTGDGTDGPILALAYANGKLYVGGGFTTVGGTVHAKNIAVWDGSHWSSLGFSLDGAITSLCFSGGKLYLSGPFSGALLQRGFVASWDSVHQSLTFLAGGLNSSAQAIAASEGDVYFGGTFTDFSNGDTTMPSNFVARWTGTEWMSLGDPRKPANAIAGSAILAVAVKDSDLYLGGFFDAAGTVAANNIARWESRTRSWQTLGNGFSNGVDGRVRAIYVSATGAIYVGGGFEHAGGVPARNIAKWDGVTWSSMGQGLHGGNGLRVSALAEVISPTEYHFYAGGRFDSAGAVAARNVAEWTGTAWVPLGDGVTGDGVYSSGEVFALQPVFDRLFRHAKLYVGGDFIYAGGPPASHIAVWDAGSWSALGPISFEGLNGPVYAIRGNLSAIYAGGTFYRAGGNIEVHNIAKWNGTAWSSLGTGVDSTVRALQLSGSDLYATGYFSNAGGMQTNMIARWNFADTSWHTLGSGFNGAGFALAPLGDDLYIGGNFTQAGGKRSYKLAHWNQNVIMTSAGADAVQPGGFVLSQNYPNPFNPVTIIKYTVGGVRGQGLGVSGVSLVVYDILGRQVAVLVNEREAPGNYEVRFDASALSSGAYFYVLTAGGLVQTRKMLVLK
jgi:trimeric autotransporter adhesin